MKIAFYKIIKPGFAGIYSIAVRLFTGSPYSHCELIFSDGRSGSASYLDGGVRFKAIEFDDTHWDFIEIPDSFEANALDWFATHKGEGYDLLGNIKFLFGMISQDKKKWFCSEAIAAALGIDDGWRYSPALLFSALKPIAG